MHFTDSFCNGKETNTKLDECVCKPSCEMPKPVVNHFVIIVYLYKRTTGMNCLWSSERVLSKVLYLKVANCIHSMRQIGQ